MRKEIWRPVVGYEGLYEVSNFGRVKNKNNLILSLNHNKKNHYDSVQLFKNNKGKRITIHILVAKAFPDICGIWFDGCVIDHINTIKTDNRAINLKVCTPSQNSNNPITHSRNKQSHINKVYQYDLDGNLVNVFDSSVDAGKYYNVDASNIRKCCRGKNKTSLGFEWSYSPK